MAECPLPVSKRLIGVRATGFLKGCVYALLRKQASPLQTTKKKKKKILISSANQAPVGTVPGEAAHTDLLREAYPPLGRLPENCTTLWKL